MMVWMSRKLINVLDSMMEGFASEVVGQLELEPIFKFSFANQPQIRQKGSFLYFPC
jgi:hypothetical protein